MATCQTCSRDMLTADSCDPRPDAILFGNEIPDDPEWRASLPRRCHDCEATQGGTHHHGCCVEWCGPCNQQRLTCDEHGLITVNHGDPQVP